MSWSVAVTEVHLVIGLVKCHYLSLCEDMSLLEDVGMHCAFNQRVVNIVSQSRTGIY